MLTGDDARDLLTRAAATIDVSPDTDADCEPIRRSPWPVLVAVAAVVAVVATAAIVSLGGGPAPAPAPTPDNPVSVPTDRPQSPGTREPDPVQEAADAAGAAWRTFARGGATPRFADRVDLLWGNEHQRYLTADEAADRTAWDLCPRWMSAPCSISNLSPVHAIANEGGPVMRNHGMYRACFDDSGRLPAYLSRLAWVTLIPIEAEGGCWAVRVFADQDGAIAAVNLLLGTPPPSSP